MPGERVDLGWLPPGPISQRFIDSMAVESYLNGPVGSGKTTTNFYFHLYKAARQPPSRGHAIKIAGEQSRRPLRRYWMTVLRDDYRQLWRSTIPSWHEQFPPGKGWSGAVNAPAKHIITLPLHDGSAIEFTAEFVALGDNDIEHFMRGYQPTAWFLNEVDLLHPDVRKYALTRAGRFPPKREVDLPWYGITGDLNAPVIDSDFYNKIYLTRTEADGFFRLPGADEPGAENRQNLQASYYENQRKAIDDPYLIRRMVDNLPSPSRAGKPVHEEYNDFLHVAAAPIKAVPGLPLILGFDAGLDPAMAVWQKLGGGRWNLIGELVSAHGTGPIQFSTLVNDYLAENFAEWHEAPAPAHEGAGWNPWRGGTGRSNERIRAWCDPAATYGGSPGSEAEAEQTWCDLVSYHTGIRIRPAPTNNTTDRRAAMKRVLTMMPDGKPAFQLSPVCKMIRAGLAGQFRYRRVQLAREERYTDEVDKNQHSHICEAAEYPLVADGEMAEVHARRERGWDVRGLPRQALDDWRMGG